MISVPQEQIKYPISLRFLSLRKPDRVELATLNHFTYLDEIEFTDREGFFNSEVKNDATITASNPTGLNNLRTSRVFGSYVVFKQFIYHSKPYQKLGEFICKLRFSARDYKS